MHELRALVGDDAHDVADTLAAMIDGHYIRHALREDTPSGKRARKSVLDCLDVILEAHE